MKHVTLLLFVSFSQEDNLMKQHRNIIEFIFTYSIIEKKQHISLLIISFYFLWILTWRENENHSNEVTTFDPKSAMNIVVVVVVWYTKRNQKCLQLLRISMSMQRNYSCCTQFCGCPYMTSLIFRSCWPPYRFSLWGVTSYLDCPSMFLFYLLTSVWKTEK